MRRKKRVWQHFVRNIIATDAPSAGFLSSYLRYTDLSKNYASSLEVMDLQKYKIIKKSDKVLSTIFRRSHIPFIFIVCKN